VNVTIPPNIPILWCVERAKTEEASAEKFMPSGKQDSVSLAL